MHTNRPFISVVVPAWNEEQEIASCLKTLEAQSYRDVEVIVVDNGSSDRTGSIARGHNVQVLVEPRQGISRARQTGFEAAGGEIIASTDADCLLPRDWVTQIATAFENAPRAVASFGPFQYRPGTAPTSWANLMIPLASFSLRTAQRVAWWIGRPQFPGSNFAVRREAFFEVDGFRKDPSGEFYSYWEDIQLGQKLNRIGDIRFLSGNPVWASGRKLRSVRHNIVYPARQATTVHLLGRDL